MAFKKTIALVSNSTWNIYNFRLNVVDKLLAEGHKVVIIAPIDEYIKYKERYPEVKHIGLRTLSRDSTNPFRDLMLIAELTRKYKKIKPDLILHYTNKPNIFGGFAAGRAKMNSIAVVTGLGYAFIHNGWVKKITKLLYRASAPFHKKFIFENTSDRKLFTDLRLIKEEQGISIKGCGVKTNYFVPSPNGIVKDKTTFTFIGRLLYDKGIVEFVEAARFVKKHFPEARFWVVGELDAENPSTIEKEDLNKWIDEKTIDYLGFVRDVRPILKKTDCVVLPSYREGLPRIILEGMSMAKPIITTRTAGCEETVDEGLNGYLVDVRSSQALVKGMEQFLSLSKEKQAQMGKEGRKKAEKEFDDKLIADQIYEIIRPYL